MTPLRTNKPNPLVPLWPSIYEYKKKPENYWHDNLVAKINEAAFHNVHRNWVSE